MGRGEVGADGRCSFCWACGGGGLFAATVQAATGFGFAIIAAPYFLLIMGSIFRHSGDGDHQFRHSPGADAAPPQRRAAPAVVGGVAGFPIALVAYKACGPERHKTGCRGVHYPFRARFAGSRMAVEAN